MCQYADVTKSVVTEFLSFENDTSWRFHYNLREQIRRLSPLTKYPHRIYSEDWKEPIRRFDRKVDEVNMDAIVIWVNLMDFHAKSKYDLRPYDERCCPNNWTVPIINGPQVRSRVWSEMRHRFLQG